MCQSLIFKKETLAQVHSCEFCRISKDTFFTEHFWTTASKFLNVNIYTLSLNIKQTKIIFQKL